MWELREETSTLTYASYSCSSSGGRKYRGKNEKLFDEEDENDHHCIPLNTFQQPVRYGEKTDL